MCADLLCPDPHRQVEKKSGIVRSNCGDLGVSEVRRSCQLEEENARLSRVVADLTLDNNILQGIIQKRSDADTSPGNCSMDHQYVQDER